MVLRELWDHLTFVAIVGICVLIGYGFWHTLERGADLSRMGSEEPEVNLSATPPVYQPPPLPAAPAVRPTPPVAPKPRAVASGGNAYKWVDDKGTIHFSDKPLSPQAELIEVRPVTTIPTRVAANPLPQGQVRVVAESQAAPARKSQTRPAGQDFQFSLPSAFQKSNDLVVLSGRVEGPDCMALHLFIHASSNQGRQVTGTTVVRDVGVGSSLFEATARSHYSGGRAAWPIWSVTKIDAECRE